MKNRPILNTDIPTLQAAIDADTFHPGQWKVDDFKGFSEVIEADNKAVVFVVYTPEGTSLRISTMWVNSLDNYRNARACMYICKEVSRRARDAGFYELRFNTKHDKLSNFCKRILKFVPVGNDEYALSLKDVSCK